ncbi:ABC transporter substrate-binding protein [Nocardioides psychrotolerans]|uniref:Glutamate transport system substrate-binding protein n=1 Tax=Nocardioides psychrotolerans TaxID=1005945 RepID=A0A1I3HGM6_9ACTN|nr:glutamate ABC transporter substrate-binding protein [Nocardioides psychrotolerans]GEP37608.1 ABC transporter substrate-binding protein [Nocardioides psychrotolerans]SFI34803.1 glutamate transport system substrate-binding protein [Nocardioides psychrotolerans]
MRHMRIKAAVAALGLSLSLAACGDAGSDTGGVDVEAADVTAEDFESGSAMAEIAEAGAITVGVKYDQPGLGFQDASSDIPTGFDVEIAKLLVAALGIDPESDSVTWEETISDNREPYLEEGRVDLVLASYSITDERRQIVGQTGPYFLTGQQVLVAADSDITGIEDLEGETVCSVTGSTSLENVEAAGAVGAPAEAYSQCAEDVLNGTVEAMSTDGSILLGLAAQNEGELKVVGEEFSEERIGVGYSLESPEMCEFINGVLQDAYDDGSWAEAFEATLGGDGVETPEPPALDACAA